MAIEDNGAAEMVVEGFGVRLEGLTAEAIERMALNGCAKEAYDAAVADFSAALEACAVVCSTPEATYEEERAAQDAATAAELRAEYARNLLEMASWPRA
jgi:hypothetical protein